MRKATSLGRAATTQQYALEAAEEARATTVSQFRSAMAEVQSLIAPAIEEKDAALALGIPTPLSPLFLGRFSPVFRRFSAVILCCLASWRQDGENGRKMAENGRNLGEKRARNSGG